MTNRPKAAKRVRRPKAFSGPASFQVEEYGITLCQYACCVKMHLDMERFFAKDCRKLAAWLIRAAAYLESKGKKR